MGITKVVKNGRTRWMVNVCVSCPDGRKRRARRWVRRHDDAKRLEHQLREELQVPEPQDAPEPEPKEVPTVAQHADAFTKHAATENGRAEIHKKKQILRDHLLPAFGGLRLDQITTRLVDAYKADKLQTLSPATVANHVSVLKRMLNVARDWGLIELVPRIRQVRIPRQDFDFLTFDEADRFLEHAGKWRTFMLVAIRTGLRLGELRGLQWGDVDLDGGRLRVARAFTQTGWETPKSGKGRTIDLAHDVVDALQAYQPRKAPRTALVFPGPSAQPLDEKAVYKACMRAGRLAGVHHFAVVDRGRVVAGPFDNRQDAEAARDETERGVIEETRRIGPHKLRHTFASHHAMRGTPLPVIQAWMGHADIATTMRYAHLCPSTRASYADNVAPNRGPRLVAPREHRGATKGATKNGRRSKNAV